MQKRLSVRRARPGVTLIMVAGVLSILAAMGAGFYTLTISQARSSINYNDTTRASLMAQAGIADAIARLHELAYFKTEDPTDSWFTINYCNNLSTRVSFAALDKNITGNIERIPGDWKAVRKAYSRSLGNTANNTDSVREGGSDRFAIRVHDAASRININAGDNLAVLMDNLCRVIGPPLVAADLDYIQPRRWAVEGADGVLYGKNQNDQSGVRDLCFKPDQLPGTQDTRPQPHPNNQRLALYGDGYAIARYRSAHGRFNSVDSVKNALTYAPRPDRPDLEALERELKYAAIKDYITIDSWVDTNSVCSGKFEWCDAGYTIAIDRDKSWIADDSANDPDNRRGSLRGSYVAIVGGHGAGQFRKIKTNGLDWIEVDGGAWQIPPGPISSYMIIGKEDALVANDGLPIADVNGKLVDDPKIDYQRYPLCIHRAPVNPNTASDRVLMALFLNVNVQHGHPMSIGTDVDYSKLVKDPLPSLYSYGGSKLNLNNAAATDWKAIDDQLISEPYVLTPKGLKRIPADSGKPVLDRPIPWLGTAARIANFSYLNNFDSLGAPGFVPYGGQCNEVHELAYRILVARQPDFDEPYVDSKTGHATGSSAAGNYKRSPFRNWDDFYFRVIKPWDDERVTKSGGRKKSVARMIMAHFNTNTDILKFNPNIEWIDRWGRNFTEMEGVMIYIGNGPSLDSSGNATPQIRPDGNRHPNAKAGTYHLRGRRYQSDEMIDQTDINRGTTQFIFDSDGLFYLSALGQVVKDGNILAERKLQAVVRIYNVWRETTQRQFCNGVFSDAALKTKNGSSSGFTDAGKPTRDATNISTNKGLDTLPEPVVPLKYTLNATNRSLNKSGAVATLREQIGAMTNSLTPPKARGTYEPDVVANKVLPANYDGQIVLAANTAGYDTGGDGDTFLASFTGCLDTCTAQGNGRELAKTPKTTQRVVDTVGLLGAFAPSGAAVEVDVDPDPICFMFGQAPPGGLITKFSDTDPVTGVASNTPYWQYIKCRQGDLRADGVYLGACGFAAKDATLKYEIQGNFQAGQTEQFTLQMWFKSNWHVQDGYEHEFFNATDLSNSTTIAFAKGKRYRGTVPYDGQNLSNTVENKNALACSYEDQVEHDYFMALHDGDRKIPVQYIAEAGKTKSAIETPGYKVQPFRWGNVGTTGRWQHMSGQGSPDPLAVESHPQNIALASSNGGYNAGYAQQYPNTDAYFRGLTGPLGYGHPFIDTQRDPEGPNWDSKYYWCSRWFNGNNVPGFSHNRANGHDLAWGLASPTNGTRVWSINASDRGQNANDSLGRFIPTTGTEAVIDELKISNKMWTSQRIADEQTLSRYYLPANPSNPDECPTFTSQTLLQSLRGTDVAAAAETVTLARVTWTVFTPRFMHENKDSHKYDRNEMIGTGGNPTSKQCFFRGPFDYVQYNRDIGLDAKQGWKAEAVNPRQGAMDLECERKAPQFDPSSSAYKQPHYTKGVEIEILDDYASKAKFIDPNIQNSIGNATSPVRIKSEVLRYRVRFRYPVDNIAVDPKAGGDTVNPSTQYLLDTPVFDDISITYFTQPRILAYKEVTE